MRIRLRVGVGEARPAGGAARGEELGGARHGRADEAGGSGPWQRSEQRFGWWVGLSFPWIFLMQLLARFGARQGPRGEETSGGRCEETRVTACDGGRTTEAEAGGLWTATRRRVPAPDRKFRWSDPGSLHWALHRQPVWSVMAVDASKGTARPQAGYLLLLGRSRLPLGRMGPKLISSP